MTAETISNRSGNTTRYTANISIGEISRQQASQGFTGRTESYGVTQVPLIHTEKLYDMKKNRQIIFASGLGAPIAAYRWPYFDPDTSLPGATDYSGLHDPNPYESGSSINDGDDQFDDFEAEREPAASDQLMTPGEARSWLNLTAAANSKQQIMTAWRTVLKRVHSDGGNFVAGGVESGYRDYLVRKLNEAREVLLRELNQ